MLAGAFAVWLAPANLLFRLALSVLLAASAAFPIWLLYSTDYRLTARELVVRAGPFHWTIALDSIEEVFPTHNPLSSPACSLDRLRIRYGGSGFGIMISPEDKSRFLQELQAREPQLKMVGAKFIRDSG